GQSTLYPMLYNLEAQGLIVGKWASAPSGRDRKYYSLTAAGQKRLAHDSEQWRAVVQALSSLGVLPSGARFGLPGEAT
ncbi:MAG: PadR family transcriptional regulator, partial [Planctomycetaceae bacterium]|nr:PadR family transcriptional regulator [Planctomycetaceae bacterium]